MRFLCSILPEHFADTSTYVGFFSEVVISWRADTGLLSSVPPTPITWLPRPVVLYLGYMLEFPGERMIFKTDDQGS